MLAFMLKSKNNDIDSLALQIILIEGGGTSVGIDLVARAVAGVQKVSNLFDAVTKELADTKRERRIKYKGWNPSQPHRNPLVTTGSTPAPLSRHDSATTFDSVCDW